MRRLNRLNQLPDEILDHIVSFLPMSEAARTCVLSKQWRYISSTLVNLKFSRFTAINWRRRLDVSFEAFVDHVIQRHHESSIRSFILRNHPIVSVDHIHRWISFGVNHNVQELSVNDTGERLSALPSCLFASTTLIVLKLHFLYLKSPTVFSCPLLKSLHLQDIEFVDADQTGAGDLCLRCECPCLETLVIINMSRPRPLSIFAPTVKYVKILEHGEVSEIPIKLSISSLCEVDFTNPNALSFDGEMVSSVVKARFELCTLRSVATGGFLDVWMNNARIELCKVEKLALSLCRLLKKDAIFKWKSSLATPCLGVKSLTLEMFPYESHVYLSAFLLSRYPNLQTLVVRFKKQTHKPSWSWREESVEEPLHEEKWLDESLCGDILMYLKKVEIYSFGGEDAEVELVRYLLQRAPLLKDIIIYFSSVIDDIFNLIGMKMMSFTSRPVSIKLFPEESMKR